MKSYDEMLGLLLLSTFIKCIKYFISRIVKVETYNINTKTNTNKNKYVEKGKIAIREKEILIIFEIIWICFHWITRFLKSLYLINCLEGNW